MKTIDSNLEDFGAEVKRRRQALGLTLKDLSARAGLIANYISSVERGTRDPSLTTLLALAGGLRTKASELLGPKPELSPSAITVGRLIERATPALQDAVLAFLTSEVVQSPRRKRRARTPGRKTPRPASRKRW